MDLDTERRLKAIADPQKDESLKQLFMTRGVLAHIVKGAFPELKDCSILDIAEKYIEPESITDTMPVSRYSIDGMHTEERTEGEGNVNFDVLFKLNLPSRNGNLCRVIVDVEPQNTKPSKYRIGKRANYYVARAISQQLSDLSDQRVYDSLQPAITIWVCYNFPLKDSNAITIYKMHETKIAGNFSLPQKDYDLMRMAFIVVGDDAYGKKNVSDTIRFLSTLLTDQLDKEEKVAAIDKFLPPSPMRDEITKEVGQMTVYTKMIFSAGSSSGQKSTMHIMKEYALGKSPEQVSKETGMDIETAKELFRGYCDIVETSKKTRKSLDS